LLLIDDEQFFFYSDESEADESRVEDPTPPAAGWPGWLEERWHRFHKAWHEADAGVAFWARRTWDWLHSLVHPDESMLVRLRTTRRIDLHHPASRPGDAVAAIWQSYLAKKRRRHLIFLCYNAAITPLAFFLFILPGPNVIGAWFAYRTVHHWLILRGIGAVRKGRIPTLFHPEAALDMPVQRDPHGKASHAAINGSGHRLHEYVNWTRPPNGAIRGGNQPPGRDSADRSDSSDAPGPRATP
jgi:hypothetical protein